MISFFDSHGIAIQAFSSLTLILITAYYAWQTRGTVKLMQQHGQDSVLPVIIPKGFNLSSHPKSEDYCIECDLHNVGNGPAFGIQIEFYDDETGDKITEGEHYIDYLEKKEKSETKHIHVLKSDLADIRYRKEKNGMVGYLFCVISFHDIYSRHYESKQTFSYEKNGSNLKPIIGTFKFIKGK